MANNRSAIRAAIQTLLLGATSAANNVYSNRETKLFQSELPAILTYTLHEAASAEGLSGRRYVRTMLLAVKIRVEAGDSVDDELDSVVAEVETIIAANSSLSGTVLSCVLVSTEVILDSSGEEDIASATLTYECKYIS
jgi:hypothetical protein